MVEYMQIVPTGNRLGTAADPELEKYPAVIPLNRIQAEKKLGCYLVIRHAARQVF